MEQDNAGQRSAKRQRFSLRDPACDPCRSKKIKCGREKPRCANCRRNCLSCHFSLRAMGRSKFGSIKCPRKDGDDYAQADERLMRIENSLALLSGALGLSSDDTASHIDPAPRRSPHTAFSIVPVSNGIVAESTDGSTRFYKSCSLVTQCFETKQIFTATDEVTTFESAVGNLSKTPCSPASSSYSVIEELQNKLINDDINHQEPSAGSFDLPPRELVDRSRTIFFSQPHCQRPILQESSFQDQVRAAYSPTTKPPCLAAIVCFRHVIVHVLRLQRAQDAQSLNSPSQQGSTWIENVEEFHKAAKAIVRSPRSLKPQFIDVQALAIAAFAALDDGDLEDFQTALHEACKLAKCIGLHQKTSTSWKITDREERLWVFWNLYILDKINLLGAGNMCLLSSFDCGAPFPEVTTTRFAGLSHESFLARIRLANIQEEVHQELFSVEGCRKDSQERIYSIGRLRKKLQAWRSQHQLTLIPDDVHLRTDFDEISTRAESSFTYYNCSVLVHHADSNPDARRWTLGDSRRCLDIVRDFHTQFGNSVNFGNLCRSLYHCLQECPFIPYFYLFSNLAQSQVVDDVEHDVKRLWQINNFITDYERHWRTKSSPSHLSLVSSTLSGLVSPQDHATNKMTLDTPMIVPVSGMPPSSLSHIMSPDFFSTSAPPLTTRLPKSQPDNQIHHHQGTHHHYALSNFKPDNSALCPMPPQNSSSIPAATFLQDDNIDAPILDDFNWHQAGLLGKHSPKARFENTTFGMESPLFTDNPELDAADIFGFASNQDESLASPLNGFDMGAAVNFDA